MVHKRVRLYRFVRLSAKVNLIKEGPFGKAWQVHAQRVQTGGGCKNKVPVPTEPTPGNSRLKRLDFERLGAFGYGLRFATARKQWRIPT